MRKDTLYCVYVVWNLPFEFFQANFEGSFRHVRPMNLPLQGCCIITIIIFILLIQIELSTWEHCTFPHQHLNRGESQMWARDLECKSQCEHTRTASVTLFSLSGLIFLVFCSSFSPSICLVSMGRAFLKRSSKLNASRTFTAHGKQHILFIVKIYCRGKKKNQKSHQCVLSG